LRENKFNACIPPVAHLVCNVFSFQGISGSGINYCVEQENFTVDLPCWRY